MFDVFKRFFVLGCMSFGGPAAHIGYFEREFVERRCWLSHEQFASGLAVCQFLPGPASSQLGMYIGYQRAGYLGALTAFIAFTFPSFAFLTLLAIFNIQSGSNQWIDAVIAGAKLLAVVVVADAVWAMGRKFINGLATFSIALLTIVWLLLSAQTLFSQLVPILIAGFVGSVFFKQTEGYGSYSKSSVFSWKTPAFLLSLFSLLLVVPMLMADNLAVHVFGLFYQAGSFVFGGGHVVLPLLQPIVGDVVTDGALVEGYAAAQLVPGPMFTMASYLGASIESLNPVFGSVIATLAIFLPGALLLFGVLPIWQRVMVNQRFAGAVSLINAAVVGLLAAALYSPVWESAVNSLVDLIPVVLGLVMLMRFKLSVFYILPVMVGYQLIATF